MKTTALLKPIAIIIIAFISLKAKSQVLDNSLFTKFSPSVVEKVYDVRMRVKGQLTKKKQTDLAIFFKASDSLIVAYIKAGADKKTIDSVKGASQIAFEALLTPLERFNYYVTPKYGTKPPPIPYSLISLAIKNKDTLGLSNTAINKLLLKLDTLKNMKETHFKKNGGISFNSKNFESEAIDKILTEAQETKLLTIKNKGKVKNYALDDWKELVERGLSSKYNKDSTLAALTSFYLAKQNIHDQYAHNKKKKSGALKLLNDNKPVELKALYNARKNPGNNTQGQSLGL